MSTVRAVAWGVLVSVALPAVVRADSMTVRGSGNPWTSYVSGTSAARVRSDLSSIFKSFNDVPDFTPASASYTPSASASYTPPATTTVPVSTPASVQYDGPAVTTSAPAPTPTQAVPAFTPAAPVPAPPVVMPSLPLDGSPLSSTVPQAAIPVAMPTPVVYTQPVLGTISTGSVSAADQVQAAAISSPSVSAAMTTAPAASSAHPADAFINFGSSPSSYLESSALLTGTPQPWYQSPAVTKIFGGTPTPDQQAQFTSDVLADVKTTFSLAGMHPNITTDPTAAANHTISVVSGATYGPNSQAIGITDVGKNGFSFIDKLSYATNQTDLEWADAHNIAHELMHAFGISYHPDQTGTYIDAGSATWALLTDPTTTFSPAAVTAITGTNFGSAVETASAPVLGKESLHVDGDQELLTVPEPTTLAGWSLALAGLFYHRRRKAVHAAA